MHYVRKICFDNILIRYEPLETLSEGRRRERLCMTEFASSFVTVGHHATTPHWMGCKCAAYARSNWLQEKTTPLLNALLDMVYARLGRERGLSSYLSLSSPQSPIQIPRCQMKFLQFWHQISCEYIQGIVQKILPISHKMIGVKLNTLVVWEVHVHSTRQTLHRNEVNECWKISLLNEFWYWYSRWISVDITTSTSIGNRQSAISINIIYLLLYKKLHNRRKEFIKQ